MCGLLVPDFAEERRQVQCQWPAGPGGLPYDGGVEKAGEAEHQLRERPVGENRPPDSHREPIGGSASPQERRREPQEPEGQEGAREDLEDRLQPVDAPGPLDVPGKERVLLGVPAFGPLLHQARAVSHHPLDEVVAHFEPFVGPEPPLQERATRDESEDGEQEDEEPRPHAVVEDLGAKTDVLRELAEACPEAHLATTTSSLRISELGSKIGAAERTFGLHPFNPVVRMELIELCVPNGVNGAVGARARAWCEAMGKTVEFVRYPGGFHRYMTHAPSQTADRIKRQLSWFERFSPRRTKAARAPVKRMKGKVLARAGR